MSKPRPFKRYLLFIGAVYYPGRGMSNFQGDYERVSDAMNIVHAKPLEDNWDWWWQVYDTETRSVLASGDTNVDEDDE